MSFLVGSVFSLPLMAQTYSACPNTMDASVPLCPEIGLLSEQYPISAVTVSDDAGGAQFVGDYLTGVFKSQRKSPPMAYVIVEDKAYEEVVQRLKKEASSPEEADEWIARLQRPEMKPYNWQQDYFDSFHDPKTGKAQLRHSERYPRVSKADFNNLVQAMNANCGETAGRPLTFEGTLVDGVSGGNLEAAGDFCLVGRDHFVSDSEYKAYAKNVCGNLDNLIETPSEFLRVGHTDEFYKTIPIPGRSPPCNFAMAVASPSKAMELLERDAAQPAFSRVPKIDNNRTYRSLCRSLGDLPKGAPPVEPAVPGTKGKTQSFLELLLKPKAAAANAGDYAACSKMTNADLLKIIQNEPDLKALNEQVDAKMKAFAERMKARVSAKYLGCNPPVIEVPQLFHGAGVFEKAQSLSIFPNPTNGEYVNGHYLMSDPVNKSFGDEFRKQLSALGIPQTLINTDFAHKNMGNLHCSSHAIRYCRPRGGK